MNIKLIRTEADYDVALTELESLMNEGEDTPYYLESRGISRTEFSAQIGLTNHRLGEILNLRRPLSINMIPTISDVTGIPADTLLQPYELNELIPV